MTDSTVDITQPFDRPQKLLKIIDNGDSTYSIATSTMAATPVGTGQVNPSLSLSYNGSDQLTQVDKVINGITYRKTLTWTGTTLTAVSAWVQL